VALADFALAGNSRDQTFVQSPTPRIYRRLGRSRPQRFNTSYDEHEMGRQLPIAIEYQFEPSPIGNSSHHVVARCPRPPPVTGQTKRFIFAHLRSKPAPSTSKSVNSLRQCPCAFDSEVTLPLPLWRILNYITVGRLPAPALRGALVSRHP